MQEHAAVFRSNPLTFELNNPGVSDQEDAWCADITFLFHMIHMYMYGLRGVDSRNKRRGGAVIMHKEQFVYSMGLEQTGFCTQAIKASTSSKG